MYCTIQDVKDELALLGESARTDSETTLAINEACDLVDSFTGRHFRAQPSVERHLPIAGMVLLSHWPVVQVVSVKEADSSDVDWEETNPGIGEIRVGTSGAVDVEYYYNDPKDPVPDDVGRCVARIAARLLSGPRPDTEAFRAGETSISMRSDPLFSDEVRWVLLSYTHRRRFL